MQEHFKGIPGFDDYHVSNLGNVKSFKLKGEKILKTIVDVNGYYKVSLYQNKKLSVIKVHQLVALAFLNHTTIKGFVIDHIDGNKLNNNISNLQIITFRQNTSKAKNGTSQYTGVSKINITKIWSATIQINNKNVHLGKFETEIEAHKMYQKALKNIYLHENDNTKFRKLLKSLI